MTASLIGLALFVLGCSHPILNSTPHEIQVILTFQKSFGKKTVIKIFQELWYFGRTSFALVALVMLTCLNWKQGLVALSVFGVTVGFEWIMKKSFNRQRPFRISQGITMLQPLEPLDPSFPSGDALRIWYLVLIIGALFGSLPIWIALAILAFLVSLGRMMMGVHYLSDILAGSGLGLVAAGATIQLWHIFGIIR